jgi:hypothetical protein
MNKYVQSFLLKIIGFTIGFMIPYGLEAQFQIFVYSDAGRTNVSEGLFIKTAAFGEYRLNRNKFEIGSQFDILNNRKNRSPGVLLNYSREFSIKKNSLEASGFFLYNKFSEFIYETNWGVILALNRRHFFYKLGTNFRSYGLSGKAINQFEIENQGKIREYRNFIYSLTYFIKPIDSKWNAGITCSNIDYFVINQETNPVFYLQGRYRVTNTFLIFVESWYKSAGSFNISVNPFGYFFRTGIKWTIDC